MLYSIDEERITELSPARAPSYQAWCQALNRLAPNHLSVILADVDRYLDDHDYLKAGFIPGRADWDGTIYQPLYEAVAQDQLAAGFFLGLIVKNAIIDRHDGWCILFPPPDAPEDGAVYFRRGAD